MDGAVAAICRIITSSDLTSFPSRDLAMQSIKVLEFVSQRDAVAVHKAGALQTSIAFIINGADLLFLDVRLSAMSVISRCCTQLDPTDTVVPACIESLSNLLQQTVRQRSTWAAPQGGRRSF